MDLLTLRTDDEFQDICIKELKFLDSLLKQAPKSYWIWNQRRWILESIPIPAWNRELLILEFMLDIDPRNFHGWDYRRYVIAASAKSELHNLNTLDHTLLSSEVPALIKKSSLSTPSQEFIYTQSKIEQNFSNYSAWHYRSKILPILFNSSDQLKEQAENELKFVRNAIFTDPEDQSAWFYQRFVIGKEEKAIELIKAKIVLGTTGNDSLILIFDQPVKVYNIPNPVYF